MFVDMSFTVVHEVDICWPKLESLRLRAKNMRKKYPKILQVLIFRYTRNNNPAHSTTNWKKPRDETEFDVEGSVQVVSAVGIETNAKRIGKVSFLQKTLFPHLSDVIINISIPVSLQWYKLNSKISAKKITHSESVRNLEQMLLCYQVTHGRAWSRGSCDSHPDENRSNADSIQPEPAHNGKISMRSPSSNATSKLYNNYEIWDNLHPSYASIILVPAQVAQSTNV